MSIDEVKMKNSTGETDFVKIPVDSVIPNQIRTDLENIFSRIEEKSFNRGPWAPIIQFGQMCYMMEESGFSISNKKCMDFGCGHERPYSISSLLHISGAKSVFGIDFSPPSNIKDVAFGIYAMINFFLTKGVPKKISSMGCDPEDARKRLIDFDLSKLFISDISGLPSSIHSIIGDYHKLSRDEKSFDFGFSGSVLEHVADVEKLLDAWRSAISVDGRIMSVIDLRDHRFYSGAVDNPWEFMIDGRDVSPGFINKMRASEFISAFKKCGFQVSKIEQVYEKPPVKVIENLLPEYDNLDADDLNTVELWVTLSPA